VKSVHDEVVKLASEIFDVSLEEVSIDSSPETLVEWDSLSHVQLVLGLEAKFDIKIPPEDGIEYFTDIGAVVAYIEKNAGA